MLRVFTAFSGYDSQCMALDKLGADYDLVGWSEIDKYAIQAHDAIYPQYAARNYGDISKINWAEVPDFDLFTYSFPCQDISIAGMQQGLEEGSGTRSSLLWDCKKAIEAKKPKYLVMENVKALTFAKFAPYLEHWKQYLASLGYTQFAKMLNSRNYGIPQNRDRFFMVSILDREAKFDFPPPFELKLRIKDLLEKNIQTKYYLSDFVQGHFHIIENKNNIVGSTAKTSRTIIINELVYGVDGIIGSLLASDYKRPKQIIVGDDDSLIPKIRQATKKEYAEKPSYDVYKALRSKQIQIRKLTPREGFRFMGVSETYIDKIQASGLSDSQQRKLAGNSIAVDVLYYIFRKLFAPNELYYVDDADL